MDLRVGLDPVENRKFLAPAGNGTTHPRASCPLRSHYPDYAVPVRWRYSPISVFHKRCSEMRVVAI